MAKFPVLRLPILAIQTVLRFLELSQLFYLVLVKKSICPILRSAKIPLSQITIQYTERLYGFEIRKRNGINSYERYSWQFKTPSWKVKGEFNEERVVDGVLFPTRKNMAHGELDYVSLCDDYPSTMNLMTEFLLFLFPKTTTIHLYFHPRALPNFREFLGPSGKIPYNSITLGQFQYRSIWDTKDDEEDGYNSDEYFDVSEEDMRYVMDNVAKEVELNLALVPPDNFRYEKNFHHEVLHIKGAPWLKPENLLSHKCTQLHIVYSLFRRPLRMPSETIRQFVINWMQGTDTTFRTLKFESLYSEWRINGRCISNDNVRRFIREYDLDDWRPERRDRCYRFGYFSRDCKKWLDIERHDGLLASIRWTNDHFEMVVWHERFAEPSR